MLTSQSNNGVVARLFREEPESTGVRHVSVRLLSLSPVSTSALAPEGAIGAAYLSNDGAEDVRLFLQGLVVPCWEERAAPAFLHVDQYFAFSKVLFAPAVSSFTRPRYAGPPIILSEERRSCLHAAFYGIFCMCLFLFPLVESRVKLPYCVCAHRVQKGDQMMMMTTTTTSCTLERTSKGVKLCHLRCCELPSWR